MTNKDFNKIIRTDIGDVLVHWTRGNDAATAFDILTKILKDSRLIGNSGYIKGGYNCVCFTESPIADLVKVFTLSKFFRIRNL